jgi:hypothetical protein
MRCLLLFLLLLCGPAQAVEVTHPEGNLRGFPIISEKGHRVAIGFVAQWLDGDRLKCDTRYDFEDGRISDEKVTLRQKPELIQDSWFWEERKDGRVLRRIHVDFETGMANAMKLEKGKPKTWTAKLKIHPGQTFAGSGVSYAIKNLRDRLVAGHPVTLSVVAYTPKPRMVDVRIRHAGREPLHFVGRDLLADRFVLHPEVSWLVQLIAHPPDNYYWLYKDDPAGFLQFQGPLQELSDPEVRISVMP